MLCFSQALNVFVLKHVFYYTSRENGHFWAFCSFKNWKWCRSGEKYAWTCMAFIKSVGISFWRQWHILHFNLVSYDFFKLVFLVYLSPWCMYYETCWLIYKENKFIPNSPIGLALDYFSQHLYWADAELSVIGSVCLDGSDPQVVINGKQGELNNWKLMFVS